MKRRAAGVVLVVGFVMLCAGGCAKNEMVKKDEGISPASAATATPPVKTEAVRTERARQADSRESAVSDASGISAQGERLQAALQKIYFDFDSYKLSDAARSSLAQNAGFIKKNPAGTVRIEGNCDERGSDEYNLALGERRARAALDYMVTLGVPANRLSFISYGEEKPFDPRQTEDAWARNRRDDFVVVAK